jgi:hypothetical protein
MTARKTTPAAPTLATLLADLDERREERLRQKSEIGSELREAKRAIDRAAHEREAELRAAVTENRKPKVAEIAERVAENEQVIADTVPRLRQVEAEIGKLDRERAALVDDRRSELVDEYIAECVQTRALLEVALAAIDAFDRQLSEAEKAGRRAFHGVKRPADDPLARVHVGNVLSDGTLPFHSATDLVALSTQATYVGGGESRWSLPALLKEIRQKLADASCLPAAFIVGRDRGNGMSGRYIDTLSGQAVEVHPDQLASAAPLITVDELGFCRLRRERDLTREELDRHERHRLATGGGYVGPYDRNRGGIVLPDDLERDKHGGVVLDPDAPPEPSVSFIR